MPLGGSIWAPETQCVQNRPSRWPLSSPPEGRLRFSSILCTPRVPWESTGLGHFGPKWPKSAQKGGTPCFDQFFSKVPASQTLLSPNSGKKSGEPPQRMVRGGGNLPTFFRFRRQGGVGARDLPEKLVKTGGNPPQINGADPLLSQKNRRR